MKRYLIISTLLFFASFPLVIVNAGTTFTVYNFDPIQIPQGTSVPIYAQITNTGTTKIEWYGTDMKNSASDNYREVGYIMNENVFLTFEEISVYSFEDNIDLLPGKTGLIKLGGVEVDIDDALGYYKCYCRIVIKDHMGDYWSKEFIITFEVVEQGTEIIHMVSVGATDELPPIHDYDDNITEINNNIQAIVNTLQNLFADDNEIKAEINSLKALIMDFTSSYEALEEEDSIIRGELADLKDDCDSLLDEHSDLLQNFEALQTKVDELEHLISEVQSTQNTGRIPGFPTESIILGIIIILSILMHSKK